MSGGELEALRPGEYLVCYELPGMSGLWGVLIAPSRSAIRAKYPELAIANELPAWLTAEGLARMREAPLWLDDEPAQGLLHVLLTDRRRD